MSTTRVDRHGRRLPPISYPTPASQTSYAVHQASPPVTPWPSEVQTAVRRSTTKRKSRLSASQLSRQKSRKRELVGRPPKQPITVDTSFTTHRGRAPRQVIPGSDDKSAGVTRKHSWLGGRRASGYHKGLGITKGTPQPDAVHRRKPSIDPSDLMTAMTVTPSHSFPDISPWDRRIPIGISVPTDSVPDFSSYQGSRYRSGSEATLVTPSIVVTPAVAMQSVWSPDTPFSESDYTPSAFSCTPGHYDVPPVPALPADIAVQNLSGHARSNTLDSAGTAFEEDDELRKKDRVISTATMFEEDMPLRERAIEHPLTVDTSLVPTPRRSQGWWNLITTPFVMTPNPATWPKNGQHSGLTPTVPMLPTQYYISEDAPASPSTYTWSAADTASVKPSPSTAVATPDINQVEAAQIKEQSPTVLPLNIQPRSINIHDSPAKASHHPSQPNSSSIGQAITSPLSAMSDTPIVRTAAIGTVLMPRQVTEQPRQININIELQDKRSMANNPTLKPANPPTMRPMYVSASATQTRGAELFTLQTSNSHQAPPSFAPPPTHAQKGSRFSYDHHSNSSSPTSVSNLKPPKKHRKTCDLISFLPFKKKQHGKAQAGKEEKKKKRGKCFWGCCCCLVFFILLAILIPVVIVLTRKHNGNSVGVHPGQDDNYQWLSLPNLPPVPTGISTIAQPEMVEEESGCVAPTTLWSCALPKELQASVKPNKPNQPNFKIQITYQDGTAAKPTKRATNPVSAGALVRSQVVRIRSALAPSPAPPSSADMNFLGRTTDGNTAPFEGESTPLFVTFQDPRGNTPRLAKRVDPTDPTNITAVVPPPMLSSDGSAAPANLLSYPSMQPLRLYNRGKDSEYYGFYTYFDRSIFLKDINGTNRGGNPADTNGGSTKDAANLRCTYADTRFFVQIWTQSEKSKPLLQNSVSNPSQAFKRPGTFPYPVTITIDRHGGDPAKKNLYCYQIESDGSIKNEPAKRFFEFEDRAFGGNLVNGTQGQLNVVGPIDGGTGGCRCRWQNWLD